MIPVDSKALRDDKATAILPRNQAQARRVAAATYQFRGCVICGLQLPTTLTIAHLDQKAGNNDPDNLAYLCGTHHWMYDACLYTTEAIKLLREHWEKTKGVPEFPRMRPAGANAAKTRKRRATARKAVVTRRRNQAAAKAPSSPL